MGVKRWGKLLLIIGYCSCGCNIEVDCEVCLVDWCERLLSVVSGECVFVRRV